MKTLIATAILLTSTSVLAHDTNFSSDACNVDLNAGLRINKELIEFTKNNDVLYQIKNNKTLIVDGDKISLSSSQQDLVTEYSTSIRAVIPDVKELAVDAVDLAIEGVNIAFTELLGSDNNISEDLTTQLISIRNEVAHKFDENQEVYIDEDGHFENDFFDQEFEEKIEKIVEETVQNSMGTLLIAVGQELLFSGGDMEAFEAKMENFGSQIERDIEGGAAKLEKRGEALCYSVKDIDIIEGKLSESISELSGFDVFDAEINGKNKA